MELLICLIVGIAIVEAAGWLLFQKHGVKPVSENKETVVLPNGRKKVWLPKAGHWAHFLNRDKMRSKLQRVRRKAFLPQVPATTLPVDSTNGQKVSCPMDGNDSLGDCGEAMICHADNILTYGQGQPGFTESVFELSALENQYETLSGGDNGMDEDMVVGPQGAWTTGIAGNKQAIAVDHMDFDITDAALTQYLIDQFYCVQMAWSVPDEFISDFKTGQTYDAPATPDPANGHFTTQTDVAANGNYTLWTWGTYCFVTPAFVAAVQPAAFVSFSPRQFNFATGLDSKGRHITTQASKWVAAGGAAIPTSVISAFPPLVSPTPTPTPTPAPAPQPAPVNPPPPTPETFVFDWINLIATLPPGWTTPSSTVIPPGLQARLSALEANFAKIAAGTASKATLNLNLLGLLQAIPDILSLIGAFPALLSAIQSGSLSTIMSALTPIETAAAAVIADLGL